MEQKVLTTLNFNLRGGRCENKVIYAVINDKSRQQKISLNEKVLSGLWDKKRQLCKIDNCLSEGAIHKQMEINKKISDVRRIYEENFLYICTSDLIALIREHITNEDMANEKNLTAGRKYSAKKAINDALKVYVSQEMVKPSSAEIYEYMVKQFCAYIDNGRDSLNHLKEDGLYKYRDYLANEVSRDRANKVISTLQIIINKVIATHPNFKKYGLKSVHIEKLKQPKRTEEEKGKISLTNEEFHAFKNVELDNDTDKRYRDLFVLQTLIGCRLSDLQKIVNNEFRIVDGYIVYISQKTNVETLVKITKEIEGYLENLKGIKIDKKTYNAKIKKIAEKANLNREIEVIDTKGNKTIKPIHKILTNHIARHTFISNGIKEKSADELKYESGHTNTQYINNVYTHLSTKDKINILEKKIEQEKAESPAQTTNNTEEQILIDDYKKAFYYLNGNMGEVMEIKDITEQYLKVHNEEEKFLSVGVPLRVIKKLYNTSGKSIEEKKEALQKIMEVFKSKKK